MVDERQQVLADPHPPEDYLEAARGLGVERVAALVMAPKGDPELTSALNDAVLELSAAEGSPFFAVCSVHPHDGDSALAELARVRANGAVWLKLHPNTQSFDVADPQVVPVVRRAGELGMAVLFDAWSPWDPAQPGKFVQLAMAAPEAKLILAHAHGPNFSSLLVYEVLAKYPWWDRRVWIDLSAVATLLADGPFAEQFRWVLRTVGVDRLLFGSDYPLDDPASAVSAVESLGFDEHELDRIFFGNATDLLALTEPS